MKIQGHTIFRQRGCSTWYTRYRKNGKQYTICGKTQKEVAEKLKDKLDIIKRENTPYTTLEQWYKRWLTLFKIGKVKETTLTVYNSLLKHIPEKFLIKNIKTITPIEIQDILNNVEGERTSQKVYEFLNDIFNSAKKFSVIKNSPIEIIDKPKHIRVNGLALSTKDQEEFIKECEKDNKYGDAFLICLYQGLRRGELLAIMGEDIRGNELVVNKSINDKNKFDTTKNKSSNRIIPIFEDAKLIFNKYNGLHGRLFNFTASSAQEAFRAIIERAGLNNKYTIHSLRHTFITNCKNINIPEHIIQQWVGHVIGSKVTSTVYTHVQKDANLLYINKLNASKLHSNHTHE